LPQQKKNREVYTHTLTFYIFAHILTPYVPCYMRTSLCCRRRHKSRNVHTCSHSLYVCTYSDTHLHIFGHPTYLLVLYAGILMLPQAMKIEKRTHTYSHSLYICTYSDTLCTSVYQGILMVLQVANKHIHSDTL